MRSRTLPQLCASILLAAALLLPSVRTSAAQANFAGTFPPEPFNGLQVDYAITGAGVGEPEDTPGFTWIRTLEGTLDLPPAAAGSGLLGVTGKARANRGWGATVTVEVCVDSNCKTFKDSGGIKSGQQSYDWETSFNVAVPVPHNAQTGRITINEVGDFNAGSRGVTVTATLKAPQTAPTERATLISTDAPRYRIGDTLTCTYQVPSAYGPVYIRLGHVLPNGRFQVLFQGLNDGTGGALRGPVSGPVEKRTLRIEVYTKDQTKLISTAETTYEVLP